MAAAVTDTVSETDAAPDTVSETEPEADPETDAEYDAKAVTVAVAFAEADTVTELDTERVPFPDTDADTEGVLVGLPLTDTVLNGEGDPLDDAVEDTENESVGEGDPLDDTVEDTENESVADQLVLGDPELDPLPVTYTEPDTVTELDTKRVPFPDTDADTEGMLVGLSLTDTVPNGEEDPLVGIGIDGERRRSRLFSVSATYTAPFKSTVTPIGPAKLASVPLPSKNP